MNLKTILESYPVSTLEKIALNKITDIGHVKLPSQAIIQELCELLCSYSYISSSLSFRRPPNFLMINFLLEQKEYSYDVISLKSKVLDETNSLLSKDFSKNIFKAKKNYELYRKILKSAWESESSIDRSEANLLSILRQELDISYQEHVTLEHDPEIASFWNGPNIFEYERNYLMSK